MRSRYNLNSRTEGVSAFWNTVYPGLTVNHVAMYEVITHTLDQKIDADTDIVPYHDTSGGFTGAPSEAWKNMRITAENCVRGRFLTRSVVWRRAGDGDIEEKKQLMSAHHVVSWKRDYPDISMWCWRIILGRAGFGDGENVGIPFGSWEYSAKRRRWIFTKCWSDYLGFIAFSFVRTFRWCHWCHEDDNSWRGYNRHTRSHFRFGSPVPNINLIRLLRLWIIRICLLLWREDSWHKTHASLSRTRLTSLLLFGLWGWAISIYRIRLVQLQSISVILFVQSSPQIFLEKFFNQNIPFLLSNITKTFFATYED